MNPLIQRTQIPVLSLLFATLFAAPVHAHFGLVIPEQPIITQEKKETNILLAFTHPFEGHSMDLVKPKRFFMQSGDSTVDLLPTLKEMDFLGHKAWKTNYQFKQPGVFHLVMEPQPYWEPAEDVSIIHYTKVTLPVFGDDEGWGTPVGLPTEIVPLSRPFGNYAGNNFTGQVLIGGKPAPGVEVEVEFYNQQGKYKPASEYHVTQLVKTDANGVFNFTCPFAGWWGFAALSEADYTIKNPAGEEKGVELGAVSWLWFDEPIAGK